MKNIFIVLVLCALSFTSAYSLEPVKVAVLNSGNAPVTVSIDLNNYTGGTPTKIFEGADQSITPNVSGVIIAIAQGVTEAGGTTNWVDIDPANVNSYYVLDVYVAGTLYAQYRLDNLILSQSQSGVADTDGNIIPGEDDAATLGSDDQR